MNQARVEVLATKHATLHAKIDQEEGRAHPDDRLLHQLKKEKLALKDAITGL